MTSAVSWWAGAVSGCSDSLGHSLPGLIPSRARGTRVGGSTRMITAAAVRDLRFRGDSYRRSRTPLAVRTVAVSDHDTGQTLQPDSGAWHARGWVRGRSDPDRQWQGGEQCPPRPSPPHPAALSRALRGGRPGRDGDRPRGPARQLQTIDSHRAVLAAAVIGLPDEKWGERPEKFVVLRAGAQVSEEDLIAHRRARIPRYTSPTAVEFVAALPKTSTGKVQGFELREKEWARHVSSIQG